MKLVTLTLIPLTLLILSTSEFAQQPDYDQLKLEAERFYAEQSYARSYELYKQAETLKLPESEARWVAFRIGDTLWRAEAGSNTSDPTKFDQAREKLELLVRDVKRAAEQDLVWVEVQESLADFFWTRRDRQNWNEAWLRYEKAFEWWARQSDLKTARERYLRLFWKTLAPPWMEASYYGNYHGNSMPVEIFEENNLQLYLLCAVNQQGRFGKIN